MNPDKKIYILNVAEDCLPSDLMLDKIKKYFFMNGYSAVNNIADSDIVLITTCCATKNRIDTSEQTLEIIRRHTHIKKIFFLGCLATIAKKRLSSENTVCLGPKEIDKLELFIKPHHPFRKATLEGHAFISKNTPHDYNVLISQGCAHRCSYCNIKSAKGYVTSRPINEIITDIKKGVSLGYQIFNFVSDDCGSYGCDINTDISRLIKKVLNAQPNIKIKVHYFYPGDFIRFYPSIREQIKKNKIISLGIPVQSGSQRILHLMKRKYSIQKLTKIIKEIRHFSPKTWMGTHIIFNFPTETRADLKKSVEIALFFDKTYFLSYSNVSTTPASKIRPSVNPKEQEARFLFLKNLFAAKKDILVNRP